MPALWAAVCELLNITQHHTTAYHPESNGMVEWAHRRFKDTLRARAPGPNWVADLLWILLVFVRSLRRIWGSQPLRLFKVHPLYFMASSFIRINRLSRSFLNSCASQFS